MNFWRSKTLMVILVLAWTTPAVALGGLALHLELEHGHGPSADSHANGHPAVGSGAHHHAGPPHDHGEHHHGAPPVHGAHFSDGSHHHHALGLPGFDHHLLPARGPVRLGGWPAQAVLPTTSSAVTLVPVPAPVTVTSPPLRATSPLLLSTVLLL